MEALRREKAGHSVDEHQALAAKDEYYVAAHSGALAAKDEHHPPRGVESGRLLN